MIAKVLPNNTLRYNGEIYEAGSEVDIDESQIVSLEGVVEVVEDGSDKIEVNVKVEETDLASLSNKKLEAILKEKGVKIPRGANKKTLLQLIEESNADGQEPDKANESETANENQKPQSDGSASDEEEAANKEEGSSDKEKASDTEKAE